MTTNFPHSVEYGTDEWHEAIVRHEATTGDDDFAWCARKLDQLAELEAAVRDLLAAQSCCPDCDGSGDRPEFDRLHQLIHGEVRGG